MKYMPGPDFAEMLNGVSADMIAITLRELHIPYVLNTFYLPITDERVRAYEVLYNINPDNHIMIWGNLSNSNNVLPPAAVQAVMIMIVEISSHEEFANLIIKTSKLKVFL